MFGLFKKKKKEEKQESLCLFAPITGKTVPLSEVPDPVFAEKLAGDGVAILPESNIVTAPADGELTLVFKTKHAFAMTLDNGVEILVHIGLETVSLNGEGFEQLAESGKHIKAGTPIIKFDMDVLKAHNLPLITPVLITNVDSVKSIKAIENINTTAGETCVVEYTV